MSWINLDYIITNIYPPKIFWKELLKTWVIILLTKTLSYVSHSVRLDYCELLGSEVVSMSNVDCWDSWAWCLCCEWPVLTQQQAVSCLMSPMSQIRVLCLAVVATVARAQSPCSPSPCGVGAQCEVQSGSNAICFCPRGYTGDPFIRCDPFSSSPSVGSSGCRSCNSNRGSGSSLGPVRGVSSNQGVDSRWDKLFMYYTYNKHSIGIVRHVFATSL